MVSMQGKRKLSNKLCDNYNPTIGILICQKANREKVEWTLEGFNKPMGVSTDNLMFRPEPDVMM